MQIQVKHKCQHKCKLYKYKYWLSPAVTKLQHSCQKFDWQWCQCDSATVTVTLWHCDSVTVLCQCDTLSHCDSDTVTLCYCDTDGLTVCQCELSHFNAVLKIMRERSQCDIAASSADKQREIHKHTNTNTKRHGSQLLLQTSKEIYRNT